MPWSASRRSGWHALQTRAIGLTFPLDSATQAQLLGITTKVTPTDTLQSIYKEVLEIGVDHYFSGDSSWTGQHILDLRTYAALCPLKHGPGVYQARSLLLAMDTTIVFYTNNCELPVEPSGKRSGPEDEVTEEDEYVGTLKLYPNPSTGSVTVECRLEEGEIAHLQIFDMAGRNVYQRTIQCDTERLEVTNLASGLYQCYLSVNQKPALHQKLVILDNR